VVNEIQNELDASYRCDDGLSQDKNQPLPKRNRPAPIPDAHTQCHPEQQQQRQDYSMRCAIREGVQPRNQKQANAEYRPSNEAALNTKSRQCRHNSLFDQCEVKSSCAMLTQDR